MYILWIFTLLLGILSRVGTCLLHDNAGKSFSSLFRHEFSGGVTVFGQGIGA